MATGIRVFTNFQHGSLGASLTAITGSDTITFDSAPGFPTLAAGQFIPLVLDPLGVGNGPEIVHMTAYTAGNTTGTIERAQEGTSGVAHDSGAKWTHDITVESLTHEATVNDGWHNVGEAGEPAYQNGWVDYSAGTAVGDYTGAGFKKIGGVVHLRGLIKNGTNATIFTLPVGYRPGLDNHGRGHLLFDAMSNGQGRVDIYNDGEVRALSPTTSAWLTLNGISFPAEA